jgi:hypothetical protein
VKGRSIYKIDDKEPIAYFILAGKVELYIEEAKDG